jgi:hypothetical protein
VYQLTGLYRGLYSTTARAFAAGTQFLYVGAGANVFTNNLPTGFNGMSFYVKLQSFNVFLQSPEDLTELEPYYYLSTGGAVTATIKLVDQFSSTDHWTLAGQYVKTLFEQAATSDSITYTNDFEGVLQNGAIATDAYVH